MNYAFDPGGIPDASIGANRLDYSRTALGPLDETALSEPTGIGDGQQQTTWTDPAGNPQFGLGNGALDWDADGAIDAAPGTVNVDLNNDSSCVSAGANGALDTTPSGDDVVARGAVRDGPDRVCNTAKSGDDAQDRPVGHVQPNPLTGFDDWTNIKFRAALSVDAGGADGGHGPDITFAEALANQSALADYLDPNLTVAATRAPATVSPGATVDYTGDKPAPAPARPPRSRWPTRCRVPRQLRSRCPTLRLVGPSPRPSPTRCRARRSTGRPSWTPPRSAAGTPSTRPSRTSRTTRLRRRPSSRHRC